jgi:hypothetical protein
MKIRPVRADLFHTYKQAGRQAGRHEETDNPFSQFCELTSSEKCASNILSYGINFQLY